MMPLRKRRRVQVVALASAALVLSTAMIGYAMRDGISYFRSPSQVAAEPPAGLGGVPHRRARGAGKPRARPGARR
jgi:cytochrome c-type biogenesis protein CcmE